MGKIIVVTSLKGGVGKTLFSAGLAMAAAKMQKSVLAVDMDLGTGGLDIALGRDGEVSPTLLDLLSGSSSMEESLLAGADGISFLASPVFFQEDFFEEVTQEQFDLLLGAFRDRFDLVLFDMPAGGGAAFRFLEASPLVDLTVLVTTPAPTAVRAAERCAMKMKNPDRLKLLINSYRFFRSGDTVGITELIYRAGVSIIGVIPFDPLAEKALSAGIPLTGLKKSRGGVAIANVALRLFGESVPLLSGVIPDRKRARYY